MAWRKRHGRRRERVLHWDSSPSPPSCSCPSFHRSTQSWRLPIHPSPAPRHLFRPRMWLFKCLTLCLLLFAAAAEGEIRRSLLPEELRSEILLPLTAHNFMFILPRHLGPALLWLSDSRMDSVTEFEWLLEELAEDAEDCPSPVPLHIPSPFLFHFHPLFFFFCLSDLYFPPSINSSVSPSMVQSIHSSIHPLTHSSHSSIPSSIRPSIY